MADGATPSSDAPKTRKRVNVAFDTKGVKKVKKGELITPEIKKDKINSLPPGFNLAGRPEQLRHRDGIKRAEIKVEQPYQTGNINTTSYWQFVVKSNKEEWIRFNPDSISVTVYGTYKNPDFEENSAIPLKRHKTIALNASAAKPFMYLDPSVLGSSFVYKAEVYINNQPVPTNSAVSNLMLHYVRCTHVYNSKAKNFLATNKDISNVPPMTNTMKIATLPFDYRDPLATKGSRIPIYLDGTFPFDRKNKTIESIDKAGEESLFFPPDTEIIVKLHVYRSKAEAIFHTNMHLTTYFDTAADSKLADLTDEVKLTFQEANLEYESVILEEIEHVKAMKDFENGGEGFYDYDIVRGQHKALEADQSTSQVVFYIPSMARLIYLLYIPDWACFPQEHTRKPLSGWSRFPQNATSINIHFAGAQNLVTQKFENFGQNFKTNDEISKKIYYEYLKKNLMINCSFEELFPRSEDTYSLVQAFVLDVKQQMSNKMEKLTIQHEFASDVSPKKQQVVCISVHPNGRAICRSQGQFRWVWEFLTRE